MATFSNIDGEESSTITFTVSAVQLTRNSSAELQEILCIGDPENPAPVARVSSVAPKSTDAGLNVRIIGGPSTVTDLAVRALLPSTAADNLVRPIAPSTYGDGGVYRVQQSSAADMQVTVAGYVAPSTVQTIAAIAGGVSIVTRSSAADHLGTVYQSSAADLQVTVTPVAGSTWRSQPGSTLWASSAGFHFDSSGALQVAAAFTGSTGPLTISQLLDSSGGSVAAADSANNAIRVNVVAGAAGGSTIVTVSNLAQSSGAPAAGSSAILVRQVGSHDISSLSTGHVTVDTGSISVSGFAAGANLVVRSSAADQLVTVYQSSFADLRATVHNSTIGDLLASVQQNSTTWQVQAKIQDSSAVTFSGATTRPTTGAQGLLTREILNDLQSVANSTVGQTSTRTALVSSVAAQRIKVYAYSITSTVVGPSTVFFVSSNAAAQKLEGSVLGTGSSGITGVVRSVNPPSWLFATAAGENLQFITPSSGPIFRINASYFIEA